MLPRDLAEMILNNYKMNPLYDIAFDIMEEKNKKEGKNKMDKDDEICKEFWGKVQKYYCDGLRRSEAEIKAIYVLGMSYLELMGAINEKSIKKDIEAINKQIKELQDKKSSLEKKLNKI